MFIYSIGYVKAWNRDAIKPERTDPEAKESEQASAVGDASWLGLASCPGINGTTGL